MCSLCTVLASFISNSQQPTGLACLGELHLACNHWLLVLELSNQDILSGSVKLVIRAGRIQLAVAIWAKQIVIMNEIGLGTSVFWSDLQITLNIGNQIHFFQQKMWTLWTYVGLSSPLLWKNLCHFLPKSTQSCHNESWYITMWLYKNLFIPPIELQVSTKISMYLVDNLSLFFC